jgi:hypothetical protein
MTTRKTKTLKSAPKRAHVNPPKARKTRAVRTVARRAAEVLRKPQRGEVAGFDFTKYVAPGAAVLASGILAAAGYAFKGEIGDVVIDALKAAAQGGAKARNQSMDVVEKLSDLVSLDSLLRHAGLRRRSTFLSIAAPAVGVACGFVAGSALTYLFIGQKPVQPLDRESGDEQHLDATPSDSASTPADRANGGLHSAIS